MILLNFTHSLTDKQKLQIEALCGKSLSEVKEVPTYFDTDIPFEDQVMDLADSAGLTPQEWQNEPLLILPPSFSVIAAVLIADLHGRMGHFPSVIRMMQENQNGLTTYSAAEVINLDVIRSRPRKIR